VRKVLNIIVIVAMAVLVLSACTSKSTKTELFNGQDFSGWKLFIPGDTVDVKTVWQVKDGVVHCTGVPKGYMRTEKAYTNYNFHVEWRWVKDAGNSGVLLHIQNEDKVWPSCMEAQLKADNAGDFVVMGPGKITIDGEEKINENRFLSLKKKVDGIEKPLGEWNSYDVTCQDGAITLKVNGTLQNAGTNSFVTSGYIGLQSEGAPIEFRNITVEEL
jgi:hypothetical protein